MTDNFLKFIADKAKEERSGNQNLEEVSTFTDELMGSPTRAMDKNCFVQNQDTKKDGESNINNAVF